VSLKSFTYTSTSGDNGVHTFSAIFNSVGAEVLTVVDTQKKSIAGTAGITVS
jgi:hypothetical protein